MTTTTTNFITTLEIGKQLDEVNAALHEAIAAEEEAQRNRDAAQVDAWCGKGSDRLTAAAQSLAIATQARVDLEQRRAMLTSAVPAAKLRELDARIAQCHALDGAEAERRAAIRTRRAQLRAEDDKLKAEELGLDRARTGFSYLESQREKLIAQHPELQAAFTLKSTEDRLAEIQPQERVTKTNTVPIAPGFVRA